MDDSDIRHNPHPKQAYEVTVQIQDAPGPFDAAKASAVFRVANHECVPKDPLSGARKIPASFPTVDLVPLGNDRYRATVYSDLLEDHDYFGLGICHWRFEGLIVSVNANGVSFGADMVAASVLAHQRETWFFAKQLFHGSKVEDLNVPGAPLSDHIRTHADAFFSMTFTAKERHDERLME